MSNIYSTAVVVAAGRGTRMNMKTSKQYLDICGKPVLARTLQVFQDCEYINDIVLVVNERDISYCKNDIVQQYGLDKVKYIAAGGEERQHSVYNGLKCVNSKCDVVLIHDGARPFVADEHIRDTITAAKEYGASCLAVPVKDTIKMGDQDEFVVETLDRSVLWSIQTPQVFTYPLIMEAHNKAIEDRFTGTDDAVLAERLGVRLKLVRGSYTNIKITTIEDLAFAEAIVDSNFRNK